LPNTLARVPTSLFVVLKTKGEKTLNESGGRKEILKNLNFNDYPNTIEVANKGEQMANLGLSDGQFLLIQIMGTYFYCP
jgi:hypothetical protein